MIRQLMLRMLRIFNKFGYNVTKKDENSSRDLINILKTPKVIFDVGSNRGQTISEYLHLFKDKNFVLHSFEPIPSLIAEQKEKFKNLDNIIYVNKVLSDKIGKILFNVNTFSDTSSMLQSNDEFLPDRYGNVYKTIEKLKIDATTIDIYCSENNITSIDLLKIDVQGAEIKVIQGAKRMLEEKNIKVIYCECLFLPFYKEQCYFGDIAHYLYEMGYRAYSSYNFGFNFKTGRVMQCDTIFVHQDFLKILPPLTIEN